MHLLCHHLGLRKQNTKQGKKIKNKRKPNELMTKTRLGTERETERRLPVSRNPENNVKRNILVNISWMEKS